MPGEFAGLKKISTFVTLNKGYILSMFSNDIAEIAQLVEHNLAKVGVAGPSPVFRSSGQNKEQAEN